VVQQQQGQQHQFLLQLQEIRLLSPHNSLHYLPCVQIIGPQICFGLTGPAIAFCIRRLHQWQYQFVFFTASS